MARPPDLIISGKETSLYTHENLFIGGWVPPASSRVIDVFSPATEEPIGRVPSASIADVDAAVAAARGAFDAGPWPALDPAERAQIVGRLGKAIRARAEEFADLISAEVGSPRAWSTIGQVGIATAVFATYSGIGRSHEWETTRKGGFGGPVRVRQVPVGVVGAIVPWNAPLFVAALKLAPALLAGCTVVLKPAPQTPLHTYLLAEAAEAAGLPPGVLSIVPGEAAASEHLVRHPGVDKISFTGSTAIGRHIGELCARDLRRCTLELGGKSAAILLPDVDLGAGTVEAIVGGAMSNGGQICVSQTRVLAPRDRYDEVVDALGTRIGALRVGDPSDPATEVGPLISSQARERVEGYLSSAEADGARLVTGGGRPKGLDRGWYVEPTLFAGVDNGMRVAREEIFGPVMVVIPYDGVDDAVRIANDSDYGLAGAVWTTDIAAGEAVAGRIRAGGVGVNSSAGMDLGSPFGGFKQSGIGREGGPEGLAAYTEYQSIILPAG
ncbi:NAD-dependent aldehyde dehydrogenase [Frankia torreyi]|uniref:NAD-dependent aldehyde dehydrogenase n=2 Tax=Frankia TaxID=1854 RepID=A0A0D8BD09_9ACTN|nr:NAD-dependent aldehyde dehydrogenase [Frankia torreyi]